MILFLQVLGSLTGTQTMFPVGIFFLIRMQSRASRGQRFESALGYLYSCGPQHYSDHDEMVEDLWPHAPTSVAQLLDSKVLC